MTIFVKLDGDHVGFQHHMPFDKVHGMGKTKAELEAEGLLVESLPEIPADFPADKTPKLFFDKATRNLFYDVDPTAPAKRPSIEESIASLTASLAGTEQLNAELLFDSMTKESRIETLEQQQADLTFELIMGGIL